MRKASWTGSENLRKPQGVCGTNGYMPSGRYRFELSVGTLVEVKHVARGGDWRPYMIRRDLGFARYESREDNGRKLIFRCEGYWIRVSKNAIRYG